MADDAALLSIRGLTVKRGKAAVLDGFDLDVSGGQIVGLLGPSGSGKTTLIRSIIGVQQVKSGTVTVLGQPAGARSLGRAVAYVSQTAAVYDDLTVAQNLGYFGAIIGASRAQRQRVLKTVGLSDHSDALVGQLSGGQRSRVSLAVALLGEPQFLVLDEPTVGLDPVLRRELWDLFHALAAEGRTLLVSSHVMDEATRCDSLVLLRAGQLVAQLTPVELLATTGAADADEAFLRIIEAAGDNPIGGTR